jgi:hypothetical protein
VTDRASMDAACVGIDAVLFLVHAMDGQPDFAAREAAGATTVRDAAAGAGVQRIVYLGGLGDEDDRAVQAPALAPRGRPTARRGPVPGHGAACRRRHRLRQRLVRDAAAPHRGAAGHDDAALGATRTQPIGVRDVLRTIVGALEVEETAGGARDRRPRRADLRGDDAALRGHRRAASAHHHPRPGALAAPVVAVGRVSSPRCRPGRPSARRQPRQRGRRARRRRRTARPLRAHLVRRRGPPGAAPHPGPRRRDDVGVGRAGRSACPTTSPRRPAPPTPTGRAGRSCATSAPCAARRPRATSTTRSRRSAARAATTRPRFLWLLRGGIDKMVGGIGLGRGRRHPQQLAVGEPVDFWRVEALERPADGSEGLLRLRAEMKVPGEAWLEFRIRSRRCRRQRARAAGALPSARAVGARLLVRAVARSTRSCSRGWPAASRATRSGSRAGSPDVRRAARRRSSVGASGPQRHQREVLGRRRRRQSCALRVERPPLRRR